MDKLPKMLRISQSPNAQPLDGDEVPTEADEPPDDHRPCLQNSLNTSGAQLYAKSKTSTQDMKKESLLTRALLSSPELSPVDPPNVDPRFKYFNAVSMSSVLQNVSGPSTAELTSDGETTSPPHTPSPPHPSHPSGLPAAQADEKTKPNLVLPRTDSQESQVEANLGRRRCITFACGRKRDDDNEQKAVSDTTKETTNNSSCARKSKLTFVCPSRPSGDSDGKPEHVSARRSSLHTRRRSPLPHPLRRVSTDSIVHTQEAQPQNPSSTLQAPHIPGLGGYKPSETTRFSEFASSLEEDDWVNQATDYKEKMTMSDCLKKENAIRKLGEEAEEEARQDEENAAADEEDDEEDEEDDDDSDDEDDGDSTDDGNESDNEAGFAESDESENESEYEFWNPALVTAATSIDHLDAFQHTMEHKHSNTSTDSETGHELRPLDTTPLMKSSKRRPSTKSQKHRPGTPNLPDSTDFVCGTLDEDRPLEAAYISCMEERRRSKHVPIPQDIDPSFPTSDLEDEDDDDDDDVDVHNTRDSDIKQHLDAYGEEYLRGRQRGDSRRTTPAHSPKRLKSPPPRKLFGQSPKRLRSPPPIKLRSPPSTRRPSVAVAACPNVAGINITGLAQRHNRVRTRSLPRTPNPFFARLERARKSQSRDVSPERPLSAVSRDMHTRGPIDIVEGLEKKRQKRKEKYWRQHCRKAAKEQMVRKPLSGKGAERMKELGLEVAERFRAYGVAQGKQLVLSI